MPFGGYDHNAKSSPRDLGGRDKGCHQVKLKLVLCLRSSRVQLGMIQIAYGLIIVIYIYIYLHNIIYKRTPMPLTYSHLKQFTVQQKSIFFFTGLALHFIYIA